MEYKDATRRLAEFRRQISSIREEMREIQSNIEPQEVRDYTFGSPDGEMRLSDLFDRHKDLLMVHNMGSKCAYCTLWADGYNGVYDHLASRAAFVVSSPDPVHVQQEFAASRGWRFRMLSHEGTSFAQDMGYRTSRGEFRPGVSVFRLEGGRLLRVSDSSSCPGDDFCALWHLLDLIPEGPGTWKPKFSYPRTARLSKVR
jgi:predicted dithiol-disulfide oxidoreductase (DUF899 family)